MLRKLLTLTAFSVIGCAAVNAQETPTPKDKIERRAQTMVFTAPVERGYLGVQTTDISRENMSKFGLSTVRGVGIEKVVENSPAAQAGLQANDVIVQFDGEQVKSVAKLLRLIAEVAPEHTAKIMVVRGSSEREFNVTLGKREMAQFPMGGNFRFENAPMIQTFPRTLQTPQAIPFPPIGEGGNQTFYLFRGGASRQIGVGVTTLTDQLGDYFGVNEGKGLLITSVRENSPAARAGIKAGDIIVEADGKAIGGQRDLVRALNEKKEGDILLTIIRDRNRQSIRVTPENSKDNLMRLEDIEKMQELEKLYQPNSNQMNFQMQTPNLAPLELLKSAPRVL